MNIALYTLALVGAIAIVVVSVMALVEWWDSCSSCCMPVDYSFAISNLDRRIGELEGSNNKSAARVSEIEEIKMETSQGIEREIQRIHVKLNEINNNLYYSHSLIKEKQDGTKR